MTPLAGWLGSGMPRAFAGAVSEGPKAGGIFRRAFGGAVSEGPNAAAIYRRAFGWAQGLRPQDRERLRGAETIPLDDRRIDALIEQAAPALDAIREAAAIGRCHWGIEILSCDDLG